MMMMMMGQTERKVEAREGWGVGRGGGRVSSG